MEQGDEFGLASTLTRTSEWFGVPVGITLQQSIVQSRICGIGRESSPDVASVTQVGSSMICVFVGHGNVSAVSATFTGFVRLY